MGMAMMASGYRPAFVSGLGVSHGACRARDHISDTPVTGLLFDLEGEGEFSPAAHNCQHSSNLASLRDQIIRWTRPSEQFTSKLLQDVRFLKKLMLEESEKVDVVVLGTMLANAGYQAIVRKALGDGEACFKNLRHDFLCIEAPDYCDEAEYIVEPTFREHFTIPHPTPLYADLLKKVPDEFVGVPEQLAPLVQMLCAEMANSFEVRQLTLPPWRKAQSILSKWVPARAKDVRILDWTDSKLLSSSCGIQQTQHAWSQLLLLHMSSANSSLSSPLFGEENTGKPKPSPVHNVQIGFNPANPSLKALP